MWVGLREIVGADGCGEEATGDVGERCYGEYYWGGCGSRPCVVASGVNDGSTLISLTSAGAVVVGVDVGMSASMGLVVSAVGGSLTVVGEHALASL